MTDAATQRVVLTLPGMDQVRVEKDIAYSERDGESLHLDLYRPEKAAAATGTVVFVSGYPGPGFKRMTGTTFREMGAYISWAELVATRGMTAITYDNVDPLEDGQAVMGFLADNASDLGIDRERIGIWSSSGNVPVALSLMTRPGPRCAALCYGYTMDLDGTDRIRNMSGQFRFVNGMAGRSFDELREIPTLIVRAGRDEIPDLLDTLDQFIDHAQEEGFPLTVIDYEEGVHAFDLSDTSEASKNAIHQIVDYLFLELSE